ncbi:MAG: metallophosphoesterase family protein [Candidatus Hodarchaeales archaeon]
MKIAIISDIHGNLEALKSVFKSIRHQGKLDHIVCLGDIVGYYAKPIECIDIIKNRCDIIIKGNHDSVVTAINFERRVKWFNETAIRSLRWTRKILLEENNKEQFQFLRKLRTKKTLSTTNNEFLFVHGTPEKKWEYFLFPYWIDEPLDDQKAMLDTWLDQWNLVAMGHTHWAFNYKKDNRCVINPGSVGQPRDENPDASYCTVEVSETRLKVKNFRVKYEIEKTCEELKMVNLDESLCTRLYLGQ